MPPPGNSRAPRGFMPVLLGEDRSETLLLRDGNEQWLECGDYTHRTCNWSLKMKTDDADPRVEQTVSGTPRDYSEDLYSLYFELIDVDGTAERLLKDFLGPLHAMRVRRVAQGFEFVAPIQCVPDLIRLLTRENIPVYQVVRQAKVEGNWR